MERAESEFKKKLPKLLKAYLPRVLSGAVSPRQFMEMVGSRMAGEVRAAMTDGQWAPLSPATIASRRHGGSTPLIDTGTLRASVSFEVDC